MNEKQSQFIRSWWAAWLQRLTRVDDLERRVAVLESLLAPEAGAAPQRDAEQGRQGGECW